MAWVGRRRRESLSVRLFPFREVTPTCAGRLAPTARTSWRTRVAEDRRGRDVAKKPSAVAGTAQSGSIRRPEQQGKGYRTWQKCENRCIAAADRLPCPCHEGQNGNPGHNVCNRHRSQLFSRVRAARWRLRPGITCMMTRPRRRPRGHSVPTRILRLAGSVVLVTGLLVSLRQRPVTGHRAARCRSLSSAG